MREAWNRKDLTGQTFGMLTVISTSGSKGNGKNKKAVWKCLCSCGTEKEVVTTHLTRGSVVSCGCKTHGFGTSSRAWKGEGDISGQTWCVIKHQATRRSRVLEFNVSHEYVWELFLKQKGRCAVSGKPIWFEHKDGTRFVDKRSDKTASLDRIDSNKGYVPGNVQWVHKDVNIMKQDLSDEDFINWCKTIADYQRQKEKENGIQEPSKTT